MPMRPPVSSTMATSVNVPPMSIPIRQAMPSPLCVVLPRGPEPSFTGAADASRRMLIGLCEGACCKPPAAPVPMKRPISGFDGDYSGPIVLAGRFNDPTCEKTMTHTRSIAVKNGHFNATILDVPFSVDLAANGGFSFSGVRQTDHATVTGTGKIAGQTMELEYNHAWCEMHAILTAGAGSHIATPPAASVPQASAPVPAPTPVPTT